MFCLVNDLKFSVKKNILELWMIYIVNNLFKEIIIMFKLKKKGIWVFCVYNNNILKINNSKEVRNVNVMFVISYEYMRYM